MTIPLTGPTRLPSSWNCDGYAHREERRRNEHLRDEITRRLDEIYKRAVDPYPGVDELLDENRNNKGEDNG